MSHMEFRPVRSQYADAAHIGETIAEVSFAIVVAGIWFLTCLAG